MKKVCPDMSDLITFWLWKILLGHNWDPYFAPEISGSQEILGWETLLDHDWSSYFEESFSQPKIIYTIYHGGIYVNEARVTLIINGVNFPLFTEMFM
ncbi:MAG TPA: hypothetical protein EYO76_02580 [Flavobacteriaceae bacterium]|nr:hypothetical protein [Flavobacteriaceae bacterium]